MTTRARIEAVLANGGALGADDIARELIDQDVSAGEYEGCSSELELAYVEYEAAATEALSQKERYADDLRPLAQNLAAGRIPAEKTNIAERLLELDADRAEAER